MNVAESEHNGHIAISVVDIYLVCMSNKPGTVHSILMRYVQVQQS